MNGNYLFTSESVTEGHPDKVADQISVAGLDAMLEHDPYARVACEVLVTTGLVMVAGEITTSCYVDIPKVARDTVRKIGYTRAKFGFDADTCAVITAIDEQSRDISIGVTEGQGLEKELGAGDQGMMFGYATNETRELMPMPIMLAHKLARRLAECRKEKIINYLRPDGKTQVTIEYRDDRPFRVDTVLISAQHREDKSHREIQRDVIENVVKPVLPQDLVDEDTIKYFVNPTGRFVVGGPQADSGLTGRKTIVDTYGGMARNGGGALSGKDPTKVDRSGAYMARYIAKNIVAAELADRFEVQVAYAIGRAEPVSLFVNSFGTGKVDDKTLRDLIVAHFPLKPADIIQALKLRRPIYRKTAVYGHFGRDEAEFTWEKTDKAERLRKTLNL